MILETNPNLLIKKHKTKEGNIVLSCSHNHSSTSSLSGSYKSDDSYMQSDLPIPHDKLDLYERGEVQSLDRAKHHIFSFANSENNSK